VSVSLYEDFGALFIASRGWFDVFEHEGFFVEGGRLGGVGPFPSGDVGVLVVVA